MKKRTILNTKNIFTISIIVLIITILSVWVYGIGKHQTVIENSLISTSILSIAFFLFISIGLYKGVKLKDDLGNITDQFDLKKIEGLKRNNTISEIPEIGEGIEGIIFSILFWIIASIVIGFLFFAFGAVVWFTVLVFMAMLYWFFFRALRLVFKKAYVCNGNLQKSLMYGTVYTVMYNFWIYGIILIANP